MTCRCSETPAQREWRLTGEVAELRERNQELRWDVRGMRWVALACAAVGAAVGATLHAALGGL